MAIDCASLRSTRLEFERASRKYGNVHHEFIDGDISKLPDWMGVKLMDDLHFGDSRGLSRMAGADKKAMNLFDGLARRAAVAVGLPNDKPRTWLEFIYAQLGKTTPKMISAGSLGKLPLRTLAVDPFTASASVIKVVLPNKSLPDTAGWLTVSQAAAKAEVVAGEISNACNLGKVTSIGKGKKRRIEPKSLGVWSQNRQRGREVRAAIAPLSNTSQTQISSGLCNGCGETVTLKSGKGQCGKCWSTSIEPLTPQVAQLDNRMKQKAR